LLVGLTVSSRVGKAHPNQFKEKSMSQKRIYLVGTPDGVRLVRATVRTQALTHVANSQYTVRVATQEDLVEYLGQVEIENYRHEQQDLPLDD
jgi:hypothetical protein